MKLGVLPACTPHSNEVAAAARNTQTYLVAFRGGKAASCISCAGRSEAMPLYPACRRD